MKNSITIILFLLLQTTYATNYYVSNSGDDANNGNSRGTSWRTLNKVNSASFRAGDSILFKRGDTFYGSLRLKASGTVSNPIIFGAYGNGIKPVITGFTNVTSWTNLGGNIWESSIAISSLTSCNMVVIKGKNTPMGRYPNVGYLPYQSHNTGTSLTSSSLTGTPNWSGANVVMRRERWYTEVDTIISQRGGTLNFTNQGRFKLKDNWGFFIQNDIRTLDTLNEWYYNPTTKKLSIYSTSSPTNVQVPTLQTLFQDSTNQKYIIVSNIAFIGANQALIDFNYGQFASIINCDLSFGGTAGIMLNGQYPTVTGNTINTVGYTGMNFQQNCRGAIITGNSIKNVYPITGTQVRGGGASIYSVGAISLIKNNIVDSSGWGAICVYGDSAKAINNFINHSCLLRDDAAGIATHGGYSGIQVIGNIVLNSIGNTDGTSNNYSLLGNGIYLDDHTKFVTVANNTVSYCSGVGLFLHRAHDITVTNNIFYNNNNSKSNFTKGQIFWQYTQDAPVTNINIKHNTFWATNSNQTVFNFYSTSTNLNDMQSFGIADSNYYFNPSTSNYFFIKDGGVFNIYTLSAWKTYSGQDSHSFSSPKTISSPDSVRLIYNATSTPSTTILPYNYIDIASNSYNGTITLQPYSSKLLIQNGSSGRTPSVGVKK